MKKILPVFLALIIFFTSTLMQVNKVQAVGPLAGVLAAGGAVAAGPYIIAGLLVAGGAAVVIGANDEDIRQKAIDIYNRTSDGFKTSLQEAIATGNRTITLTSEMKAEIQNSAVVANSAGYINYLLSKFDGAVYTSTLGNYKYVNNGNRQLNMSSTAVQAGLQFAASKYLGADVQSIAAFFTGGNLVVQTTAYTGTGFITHKFVNTPTTALPADIFSRYDAALSTQQLIDFLHSVGVDTSISKIANAVPVNAVLQGNFETALQGLNEVDIPLDAWLAEATTKTGQKVNVDTATGSMTLEDGTPYEGDISVPWTIPKGEAGSFPDATISNPAVPVDEVFPDVAAPSTEVPSTGDGILQGLWDWLKGILQKILDAILALASLVGLIALVESIINIIESISESVQGWKNAPTKKIEWSKLAVAAGTLTGVFPFSIPWDVYRLFNVLNVQPITPVFEIDINKNIQIVGTNIPIKYDFDIDFSIFNPIAAIGRWGLILIFDISIIMALRRLTPD